MSKLDGKNAVVVGASRGLGRGVAESLSAAGASVFAIAREYAALEELQAAHRSIDVAVAEATDPTLAGRVIDEQEPDILVVIAGASPLLHPIHQHTWETFSLNWEVDVRLTFNWLREALLKPLRPGSR
ncbi:MAG: SDR family oxidoreductase, partial [Solirubrobacterales bacterium]|nr:SDR family oxidoreductase [Solirubrobacterales bacterium]